MRNKNLALYAILAVVLIVLVFSVTSMYKKDYTEEEYNQFVSAEQQDKCATPSGYTDEEWKQHMSHHPDRYKECLT
jgi:cell division protein FtsN